MVSPPSFLAVRYRSILVLDIKYVLLRISLRVHLLSFPHLPARAAPSLLTSSTPHPFLHLIVLPHSPSLPVSVVCTYRRAVRQSIASARSVNAHLRVLRAHPPHLRPPRLEPLPTNTHALTRARHAFRVRGAQPECFLNCVAGAGLTTRAGCHRRLSLAGVGLTTHARGRRHVLRHLRRTCAPRAQSFATPAPRGTVHAMRARLLTTARCPRREFAPHSQTGAPPGPGTLCSERAHQRAPDLTRLFLSCGTASSQLRSTRTFLRPPTICNSLRLHLRIASISSHRHRPAALAPRPPTSATRVVTPCGCADVPRGARVFLCCMPVSRMRNVGITTGDSGVPSPCASFVPAGAARAPFFCCAGLPRLQAGGIRAFARAWADSGVGVRLGIRVVTRARSGCARIAGVGLQMRRTYRRAVAPLGEFPVLASPPGLLVLVGGQQRAGVAAGAYRVEGACARREREDLDPVRGVVSVPARGVGVGVLRACGGVTGFEPAGSVSCVRGFGGSAMGKGKQWTGGCARRVDVWGRLVDVEVGGACRGCGVGASLIRSDADATAGVWWGVVSAIRAGLLPARGAAPPPCVSWLASERARALSVDYRAETGRDDGDRSGLPGPVGGFDTVIEGVRLQRHPFIWVLLRKGGRSAVPSAWARGGEAQYVRPTNIPRSISCASPLPPGSPFHLVADVERANQHFPVCIPPRTSTISRFSCRIMGDFYMWHSRWGLIFASLSLPNLEELRVMSTEYHATVAEWPHAPFLELFGRSGFHRSLKVLRIAEVLITDGFLIATLSSLDSLEHLYRSQKNGKSIVLVVVTPNFLRAITFQTPDYRIPRPRHFVCTKQLQFAERAFVVFLSLRGSKGSHLSTLLPDLQVHRNSQFEHDII
ncbi:hypothetical protein C8J57DRAFT_1721607 [Mycena rebaudengoi]|nr:hypothetical protein C8J57DRAFT_1721607 [Mycena rebaudengoi]